MIFEFDSGVLLGGQVRGNGVAGKIIDIAAARKAADRTGARLIVDNTFATPYLTTMLYLPPERRTGFGVAQNTVRLSLGIEPPETLLGDLEQAVNQV